MMTQIEVHIRIIVSVGRSRFRC